MYLPGTMECCAIQAHKTKLEKVRFQKKYHFCTKTPQKEKQKDG